MHLVNASLFVSRSLAAFVILLCCVSMKETVLILKELTFYYRKYSRRKTDKVWRDKFYGADMHGILHVLKREASDTHTDSHLWFPRDSGIFAALRTS